MKKMIMKNVFKHDARYPWLLDVQQMTIYWSLVASCVCLAIVSILDNKQPTMLSAILIGLAILLMGNYYRNYIQIQDDELLISSSYHFKKKRIAIASIEVLDVRNDYMVIKTSDTKDTYRVKKWAKYYLINDLGREKTFSGRIIS